MPTIQNTKITTVHQHITREENLHPEATGEFSNLLNHITLAISIISRDVRRAGLNDILGITKGKNVHGERVKKLDVYANEVLKKIMESSGNICVMASEEDEEHIPVHNEGGNGRYVLVFDPLDGSSNIEVNVTIGTIFSLYKRLDQKSQEPGTVKDILQPGYKQVGAGYALFGSSTILVYTTGHGVHTFTYDPTIGEFLLTNENLKMPSRGNLYSCNEGYYHRWNEMTQQYIDYLKTPSADQTRPYGMRYIGSGVADIHRTLYKGGIFLYPADSNHPNGKLRLVYEANPLAMIIEQAGGRATDGNRRILEIQPKDIHERTPLILGSKEDVFDCETFLKNEHPYQTII